MAVGSTGTLSSSSITVSVGESGQITWSGGAPQSIVSANTNIATVTKSGLNSGTITVTGVSVGNTTATIQWADGISTISITVAASDDTLFLNKRGLAYFWGKIDDKKQNKLTPGSNITISGDTISASQPTVNNGQLTIQKNGSSVGTFTANQSGNTTANIVVPTKTSDITNDSGFITSSGTVAKANQLTTARTIGISGGATGTATSFNGTANISIPITGMYETYLNWGNQNLSGRVSCVDAALSEEFSANRLAYMDASKITVEYSRDGGSTWTDYGLTAAQKTGLVTTSQAIYTGGTNSNAASNYRVRVNLNPTNPYMATRKLFVYISTGGVSGAQVLVERKSMGGTSYETVTTATISGWSGWNSIPINITFGGSASWSNSDLRLTFSYSGKSTSYPNAQLQISKIRLYGETAWSAPSNLATNGHMYTYDTSQNVTFPANVSVTGSLKHGNYAYTLPNKNGTVAMTSDIPSSITVDSALSSTSTNPVQNKVINTALNGKQHTLTAGSHIDITNNVIKAKDYVHSESPVTTGSVTPVVTNSMITNGTITADKFATGAVLKLTMSTTDIGEGAALAANTLYGVYD